MGCKNLKQAIKIGTSECMIRHILFTNSHHYGHLTHDQTVERYRGTVLGESLDFEKLEELAKPKPEPSVQLANDKFVVPPTKPVFREPIRVLIRFEEDEITELFEFLDKHKDEHPGLHEKVFRSMTGELFRRINQGG